MGYSNLWLGRLYSDMNVFDKAEHFYNQALNIMKTKSNDDWVGEVLHQQALLLFRQDRTDQALELYKKALSMMSEKSSELDNAREGYAQVLLSLGDLGEAQKLLELALIGHQSSTENPSHSKILRVKMLLGLSLVRQGREKQALVYLSESVPILEDNALYQVSYRKHWLESARRALKDLKSHTK